MNFTGKIIHISDVRTGTSSTSGKPWACQEYVIEDATARFPLRMCFTVFGQDTISRLNLQDGQSYTVDFDIDAHEYNGRWYNSIRAYAATPLAATPPPTQQGAAIAPQPIPMQPAPLATDTLPF